MDEFRTTSLDEAARVEGFQIKLKPRPLLSPLNQTADLRGCGSSSKSPK
jgi:hypothetical protein